ncbi:hypothetical protein BOTBODRAFT_29097 [Botryobasidium botryosum FD-172 SS1]|uniref:Uncharacterized protein n=1 Tax=Botryobasidium botryosum (strain FD-172 SS1) TaxID=930990 RepID=A0A067MSY0_BOTB1|nr:hypothetical protein BOTBODRAFT_29097 [Botryobasidium botryosum FD-172 SS1]
MAAQGDKTEHSELNPSQVLSDLLRKDWESSEVADLAQKTVEFHLANYDAYKKYQKKKRETALPSLATTVGRAIAGLTGEDTQNDVEKILSIPGSIIQRNMLKWDNMPYPVLCALRDGARKTSEVETLQSGDVDEWIIRNEGWLRDGPIDDWTRGMVALSKHADFVFPSATLSATSRTITRTPLFGFTILDKKHPPAIKIQPSVELFSQKFDELTGNLLKGLSWENIFVAGGIVTGSLFCVSDSEADSTPEMWLKSDIDVYIYGLDSLGANLKIKHIFEIFKANLTTDSPPIIVRNSKTITFFTHYPTRRVQIVLKLVDNPKDVLLNFDLDVCSMGWDGEEVWMLPRAARALETGYNVFTMNLVQGHYLGTRRATQEQRIFKYANKGYGIRFLPSYVDALLNHDPEVIGLNASLNELDMAKVAEQSRRWTASFLSDFLSSDPELRDTETVTHPTDPTQSVELIVVKHQYLASQYVTSHSSDIVGKGGRSFLAGFGLFMRHVALWEAEKAGKIVIREDMWASPSYWGSVGAVNYDDTPRYYWDDTFYTGGLKEAIEIFNQKELAKLEENLQALGILNYRDGTIPWYYPEDVSTEHLESILTTVKLQRMAYGSSVEEILASSADMLIPLWVPRKFIRFANDMVRMALDEAGLPSYDILSPIMKEEALLSRSRKLGDLRPVLWRTTASTMWQQIDRRIDEVYEILWAFHRVYESLWTSEEARTQDFKAELSRHATRQMPGDELIAFARWVGKKPPGGNRYNEADWSDLEEDI